MENELIFSYNSRILVFISHSLCIPIPDSWYTFNKYLLNEWTNWWSSCISNSSRRIGRTIQLSDKFLTLWISVNISSRTKVPSFRVESWNRNSIPWYRRCKQQPSLLFMWYCDQRSYEFLSVGGFSAKWGSKSTSRFSFKFINLSFIGILP